MPNRSAAREEALAVILDLSNPEVAGNRRCWASWFLQVADEKDQFFRAPIGHPALEIVLSDGQELHAEEPELNPLRPTAAVAAQQDAASSHRSAALVEQIPFAAVH